MQSTAHRRSELFHSNTLPELYEPPSATPLQRRLLDRIASFLFKYRVKWSGIEVKSENDDEMGALYDHATRKVCARNGETMGKWVNGGRRRKVERER